MSLQAGIPKSPALRQAFQQCGPADRLLELESVRCDWPRDVRRITRLLIDVAEGDAVLLVGQQPSLVVAGGDADVDFELQRVHQ